MSHATTNATTMAVATTTTAPPPPPPPPPLPSPPPPPPSLSCQADASILNGVVPHPSLPFLASYGIDDQAKLWVPGGQRDDDVDCRDFLPIVLERNLEEVRRWRRHKYR